MNLMFTFRNLESSDALRDLIRDKISKLDPFLEEGADVHVILEMDGAAQRAEINLMQKDLKTGARADTEDLYKSIDEAVQKLRRQMRRHKERRTDHR